MRRFVWSVLPVLILSLPAQDPAPDKKELEKQAQAATSEQRWADAAAAYRKLTELDPKNGHAWHMAGFTLHMDGKLDEALPFHVKATEFPQSRPVASYNVACVHALKGDKEKAFEWLGKAVEAGFTNLEHITNDPDMDPLHADPRWEKLIAAIKAKPVDKNAFQVFSANSTRGATRILLWGQAGPLGQVSIDYGAPVWKEEYSGALASPKFQDRRWRLGQDFWTTLDTQLPLSIGGVDVEPGQYYLTLERTADGKFLLALLDPAPIRKQKLDSYVAHKTEGGTEVEMTLADAEEHAGKLEIALVPRPGARKEATLEIRFGPHVLSAPVQLRL